MASVGHICTKLILTLAVAQLSTSLVIPRAAFTSGSRHTNNLDIRTLSNTVRNSQPQQQLLEKLDRATDSRHRKHGSLYSYTDSLFQAVYSSINGSPRRATSEQRIETHSNNSGSNNMYTEIIRKLIPKKTDLTKSSTTRLYKFWRDRAKVGGNQRIYIANTAAI